MADVNIFTQDGEEFVADLITGIETVPAHYYIGWGTGATEAAKADSAIETESGDESRGEATLSQPSADIAQFYALMTCTSNPKTIKNAGVLTALADGVLALHSSFTGIVLAVGDKIDFTFTLELT